MRLKIQRIVEELRAAVATLEPDDLPPSDSESIVDLLSEGERLCQAGRAVATQRLLKTRA